MEEELRAWAQELVNYHLPRWEELPEMELYMDQIVTLIEKYLGGLLASVHEKSITPAMVNNYVKLKLIPAPNKKRYNRVHLAYLIAITILKQVLTIREVQEGVLYQSKLSGTKQAYNEFCTELENALHLIMSQVQEVTSIQISQAVIPSDRIALRMASLAFASKLLAEQVVTLQTRERTGNHE